MLDLNQFPYMVFRAALVDAEGPPTSAAGEAPRTVLVSTAESRCVAITWTASRPRDLGLVEVSDCTALNTTDADGNWVL